LDLDTDDHFYYVQNIENKLCTMNSIVGSDMAKLEAARFRNYID